MVNRSSLAAALVAAALLAAPTVASARFSRGGQMLSLWGVLDPAPDGIGAGARVMLPLVPEGLLHARIKDELTLEFGADFVHYEERVGHPGYPYFDYSWNGFLPVVGVAWNFWFTRELALYPKLDVGYWFGWYSGWRDDYVYGHRGWGGAFLQGAVGLIYQLQSVALRVELGSGLMRIGVGFPF